MHKHRTKRINKQLNSQLESDKDLVFLLQDVDDEINVGAMFRIADGCNAELILCGKTPTPPNNAISMTARGLERGVPWSYLESTETAIEKLRQLGFEIIAVELSPDAVLYSEYEFTDKVCLVLGNEAKGVYKKTIEKCDASIFMPMLGKGPSLNVHVAAAIAGYAAIA